MIHIDKKFISIVYLVCTVLFAGAAAKEVIARSSYDASGPTTEGTLVEIADNTGKDVHGFSVSYSPIHDLRVAQLYRLVGVTFNNSPDTKFWTFSTAGTGATATISHMANLVSGSSNTGYSSVQSVHKGRFMFAHPHLFRAAVRVPSTSINNNTRRWGVYSTITASTTPNDGFYFSISGDNTLSICRAADAVSTCVSSGSFNGTSSTYTLDTNVHAYEIVHFVMGSWFFIDNVLIHKFLPTSVPLVNTLTLNATAISINSGASSGAALEIWAMSILRIGKESTQSTYSHISTATTTTLKLGPGVLHRVVLNNPTNNSITILDGSSTIAVVNPGASATPLVLDYHAPFETSLTIITAGTPDITVLYE